MRGTISVFWRRGWLSCSAWHSAQSNHFRPGFRLDYLHRRGEILTAGRSDRDLRVEDVFARTGLALLPELNMETNHMVTVRAVSNLTRETSRSKSQKIQYFLGGLPGRKVHAPRRGSSQELENVRPPLPAHPGARQSREPGERG